MRIISIGIVALLTIGMTGCAEDEPEYTAVCVNQETQVRLADSACDSGVDGALWYYLLYGTVIPRVGAVASGGYKTKPAGITAARKAPASGVRLPVRPATQQRQANQPRPVAPRPIAPAPRMK